MDTSRLSLLLFVILGLALVNSQEDDSRVVPVQMEGVRPVERRYAESAIASDISKIVDSMAQKNFVNFLLNRKEKKSKRTLTPDQIDSHPLLTDLIRQDFMEWIFTKIIQDRAD
ncbi:gastric inhibitory polypeptide [Polypterus senegalus]|uniref:gastric inhibitory polypeptide n=1 Tax=Polypterus senegalus TaxID=55291 RepID=UPI00196616D9|nr:gastric inhibitory polypeptide [Polypterus senegalus]